MEHLLFDREQLSLRVCRYCRWQLYFGRILTNGFVNSTVRPTANETDNVVFLTNFDLRGIALTAGCLVCEARSASPMLLVTNNAGQAEQAEQAGQAGQAGQANGSSFRSLTLDRRPP
jgi:hypothetical protein